MSRGLRFALLAAALLAGYLVYRSCRREDEAAIRGVIQEMIAAAEERNAAEFMRHFSSQYKDNRGNNFLVIFQMVKRTFEQVAEIQVRVEDVSVVVTGEQAFVTLSVATTARGQGQVLYPFGREDSPEHPRITFRKERFDWKIVQVEGVEQGGL